MSLIKMRKLTLIKSVFIVVLSLLVFSFSGGTGYAASKLGIVTLRDKTKIHFETRGDPTSPHILFIHGWSCSSAYWQKQLGLLSSRYYTVAIDLRGHGRSDKPAFGYTLECLAQDVHEVMEKLELKDVTLVGWSMGGSIVFEYYRQFADEYLNRICIVDIGPYSWKNGDYPSGMDWEKRLELTRNQTMVYQDPATQENDFVEKMFVLKPGSLLLNQLQAESGKAPAYVRSLLILELFSCDYRELLTKIDVPTLILLGSWFKQEKYSPLGEYMQKKIKSSQLFAFAKSGHCPFLEETDTFNQKLIEFIEDNR